MSQVRLRIMHARRRNEFVFLTLFHSNRRSILRLKLNNFKTYLVEKDNNKMNFESKFQIRFIKRMFMNETYVKTLSLQCNADTIFCVLKTQSYIVKLHQLDQAKYSVRNLQLFPDNITHTILWNSFNWSFEILNPKILQFLILILLRFNIIIIK